MSVALYGYFGFYATAVIPFIRRNNSGGIKALNGENNHKAQRTHSDMAHGQKGETLIWLISIVAWHVTVKQTRHVISSEQKNWSSLISGPIITVLWLVRWWRKSNSFVLNLSCDLRWVATVDWVRFTLIKYWTCLRWYSDQWKHDNSCYQWGSVRVTCSGATFAEEKKCGDGKRVAPRFFINKFSSETAWVNKTFANVLALINMAGASLGIGYNINILFFCPPHTNWLFERRSRFINLISNY